MKKVLISGAAVVGLLLGGCGGCDKGGEENPPPVSTNVGGGTVGQGATASVTSTDGAASAGVVGAVPTHGGPDDMNGGATPPALPDGHPALPAAPSAGGDSAAMAPPARLGSSVMPTPQAGDLVWKLPAGWTETGPTGMRAATLLPPGGVPECTVFKFGGVAGGMLSNVNRWRGQVGLEPLTEATLSTQLAERKIAGGAATAEFCDMTGPKGRVIGAVVVGAEGTWFFKMQSTDASKVEGLKPGFLQVVDSLSFQK
jgi:hypothetical protein